MGCAPSTAASDAKLAAAPAPAAVTLSPAATAPSRTRKNSVMDEIDALEDDVTMVVSVQSWLEGLAMADEYWPKFEAAGYDDLDIVADMKEDELKNDVGVVKVGHLKKLLKEVQKLKSGRRASSVSDLTSPKAKVPGEKPMRVRKGSVMDEIEAMDGSVHLVSFGSMDTRVGIAAC